MEYFSYMSERRARKTNERWRTPMEVAIWETPDISECMEFTFWQKVHCSYDEFFPASDEKLVHLLGVSGNRG